MLVSVTGLIGSGKDTVADYLVQNYNFKRVSFAGALKDAVSCIFGWDREMIEGKTKASREWREQIDQWWSKRLNIPELSPRWVLQQFGTNVCRAYFHDDIWIAAVEHRLLNTNENIVISDARFVNELEAIKRLDGTCFYVERGELPAWFNWAMRYNTTTDNEQRTRMRIVGSLPDAEPNPVNCRIHSSEWEWVGFPFDHSIDNDGTVDELYKKVDSIINL